MKNIFLKIFGIILLIYAVFETVLVILDFKERKLAKDIKSDEDDDDDIKVMDLD